MGTGRNILLYPLSLIYGLITGIRNLLYDSGILPSTKFEVTVISVGNITVGGTGKTPHTEYIVSLLKDKFKIATLSRGYKRKTRDFRIATISTAVSDIGDEPMQIFRKFPDILVAVDRNRVEGVKNILNTASDTGVIILDDAFQHRRITPGLSILLSDFGRPVMTDYILPFGNLRESRSNMKRADIIVITKCPEDISPKKKRTIMQEVAKYSNQNIFFTTNSYCNPLPVFDDSYRSQSSVSLNESEGKGIVLVTGIANPKPLKEYLQKFFGEIVHLSFPDHYNFKERDIKSILSAFEDLKSSSKYLFTTEKDAVRLREFTDIKDPVRQAFFYIPVGIQFLNDDKEKFDNIIVDYVRKSKRDN